MRDVRISRADRHDHLDIIGNRTAGAAKRGGNAQCAKPRFLEQAERFERKLPLQVALGRLSGDFRRQRWDLREQRRAIATLLRRSAWRTVLKERYSACGNLSAKERE
jgi:hypothetical protein